MAQGTVASTTQPGGAPQPPAEVAYEQEIRFAVVMYGGVSLAIYINGVAQELLNLVRATAPARPTRLDPDEAMLSDAEIEGTTAEVYRELGRLLHRRDKSSSSAGNGRPIRTRFVVDVLSGSSAGGLNGIYLAKALVNDQPIEALKQLWVDEADIAKIVNDDKSYGELGFARRRPPESALNSRRMYAKLLEALDGMDRAREPRDETFESPYVDELDLWITTTDVRGVTVPIDTFDRFVFEKRHRKVFRFVYGSAHARGELEPGAPGTLRSERSRNDFLKRNNPFLAFAGRCTSAFPFAFEPMQLNDIDQVLSTDRFRNEYHGRKADSADWRRYFEEYLKPGASEAVEDVEVGEQGAVYRTQSFADGGYLDNKPFTWATRSLGLRRADLPVDRRLIYIEPDPGAAGLLTHLAGEQGDLVAAWKAYGPLAHIDPEKAGVRPNAIENAVAALTGIPRSEPIRDDIADLVRRNRQLERVDHISAIVFEDQAKDRLAQRTFDLETWRRESVADIIEGRGIQYGAYHRLKVAAVADDLAALVTRLAGFDEESDEYSAIRCFVEAWIQKHHPENGEGEASQNEFLLRYDLSYRLRRTGFLIRQIDRISEDLPDVDLSDVRRDLNGVLTRLRAFGRALRARTPENPIRERVAEVSFDRVDLRHVLNGARSKEESVRRAKGRLGESDDLDARLTVVADGIRYALFEVMEASRNDIETAIASVPDADARQRLAHHFEHYEVYDSVLFPTSYGSVSEGDRVEVVRISPQDATSIIDETRASETRRKLAGSAIHHFGGFFDRAWRRNDILWGRLDAAERLITSLLPVGLAKEAADLLERAQIAIVREEFTLEGRTELENAFVQQLLRAGTNGVAVEEQDVRDAVKAAQKPETILEFLRTGYEVDRQLDAPSTLKTVGRMTAVTGEVLDGIVGARPGKAGVRWVTRLGRLTWGLGEIATERSFPALLWRWWAQLLILVAVLMIVGGAIFGAPATTKGGWLLLALLAGIKAVTWIAEELTGSGPGQRWIRRALVTAAIAIAVLSTGWAAYELYSRIDERVDEEVCGLPDRIEEPVQALWPWDDDVCPPRADPDTSAGESA